MRSRLSIFAVLAFALSARPVFGCSCNKVGTSADTPEEIAKKTAQRADAIFEGKVKSDNLKWIFLDAKIGDLISASSNLRTAKNPPAMEVSFDISRSYRGTQEKSLNVKTGLGGGDCGFAFQVGEQYLVYAFKGPSGQFSTSICTGTGLLDQNGANLSYLRGEPITEEEARRIPARVTGRLCGRAHLNGSYPSDGRLFLLRVGTQSPLPYGYVETESDGSFCSSPLSPGQYYLVFANGPQDSPMNFAFFPGVAKAADAVPLEVTSNRGVSGLEFDIPGQLTSSVSGTIATSDKSSLPAECRVILFSADPPSLWRSYSQLVKPNGDFDFPQVLPGKYWAFVAVESGDAARWLTRKTEVNVDGTTSNLSLELIPK